MENGQLASLYDFENRRNLFPEIDSRMKFSLLTMTRDGVPETEFAFFLHTIDDLTDPERCFNLSVKGLMFINPNTRTMPVFRTRQDAELTIKLYRVAPVLVNRATKENPWKVIYSQGLFHSSNDIGLFAGDPSPDRLPLYDGRMIQLYNHRAASVGVSEKAVLRTAISLETQVTEYQAPSFRVQPRYWVPASEVFSRVPQGYRRKWTVAFKDITSATNERTAIFAVIPCVGVSDRLGILWFGKTVGVPPNLVTCFIANANSLVFDFIVRQKVGGVHLKKYIIEQLPVLLPDRYTPDLLDFIVPRVVELTYAAWDLQPFTQDVLDEVGEETWARWFKDAPIHTSPPPAWAAGPTPAPFVWDEERRAILRAELDGLYAHLYGLTREELAYILDTFPIVRRKDEERWGEYRTKRMVLEAFESLRPLIE